MVGVPAARTFAKKILAAPDWKCGGSLAMFTFHCVINIAMVLSAGPVVGIPLPFVSTGGTSLVMSYASL